MSPALIQKATLISNMADNELDKDLTNESEDVTSSLENKKVSIRKEFFKKEECRYGHRIFATAGLVYSALSKKKLKTDEIPHTNGLNDPNTPKMDKKDVTVIEKRLTFELAFSTLKYASLLEFILEDCVFFSHFPELEEDESLVMVIFCDFMNRKFQSRTCFDDEELDPRITDIEMKLFDFKTKLNAALARNRIKHQAVTIEHLLPEKLREKEDESSMMPLAAWINQLKITIPEMETKLGAEGFVKVDSVHKLTKLSYTFDSDLDDLLLFSPNCRKVIPQHDFVDAGLLVLQDKASCLAPHIIRNLIKEGDDVIHVNCGLGMTSAHISSLNKENKVIIFGPSNQKEYENVVHKLGQLGAKNVKLMSSKFVSVSRDDSRLKHAKIIYITARCTKSAINNPIDFIVNEGEDMTILRDLSLGGGDDEGFKNLNDDQLASVSHAVNFARVSAIVYQTRSFRPEENEVICEKALTKQAMYTNALGKTRFRFRVVPPAFPFTPHDIETGSVVNDNYIKLKSSNSYDGAFIATLAREPEEANETAKQVLARAEAKGLLAKGGNAKTTVDIESEDVKQEEEIVEEPEDIIKMVMREFNAKNASITNGKNNKTGVKHRKSRRKSVSTKRRHSRKLSVELESSRRRSLSSNSSPGGSHPRKESISLKTSEIGHVEKHMPLLQKIKPTDHERVNVAQLELKLQKKSDEQVQRVKKRNSPSPRRPVNRRVLNTHLQTTHTTIQESLTYREIDHKANLQAGTVITNKMSGKKPLSSSHGADEKPTVERKSQLSKRKGQPKIKIESIFCNSEDTTISIQGSGKDYERIRSGLSPEINTDHQSGDHVRLEQEVSTVIESETHDTRRHSNSSSLDFDSNSHHQNSSKLSKLQHRKAPSAKQRSPETVSMKKDSYNVSNLSAIDFTMIREDNAYKPSTSETSSSNRNISKLSMQDTKTDRPKIASPNIGQISVADESTYLLPVPDSQEDTSQSRSHSKSNMKNSSRLQSKSAATEPNSHSSKVAAANRSLLHMNTVSIDARIHLSPPMTYSCDLSSKCSKDINQWSAYIAPLAGFVKDSKNKLVPR